MGIADDINARCRRGLEAMGSWAEELLKARVSHQTGPDGPGSPVGTPPFRRTGVGQASIAHELTEDSTQFVLAIGNTQPDGANYLAAHDQGIDYANVGFQQRPWLSDLIEKYGGEMSVMFRRGFED